MNRHSIIIDCDPGLDDAVCLLLALGSPEDLSVLGITTVAGNVPLDLTQRNARIICQLAGQLETKIYAGCAQPLFRDLVTAGDFHGSTGLLGIDIFEPEIPLQSQHAVDFIVETLMIAKDNSITLVPIGPLTNIAMAIIKERKILPKIQKIVLMGGSVAKGGNVTPAAEFNIYVDPHAADIVFKCGRPVVVMGLDVTHQALITKERIDQLTNLDTPIANMAITLFESIMEPFQQKYNLDAAPLHDPCTIAYLLQPNLFLGKEVYLAVETQSELTMGATVVDDKQRSDHPNNAVWMTDINAEGFFDLITDRITNLGS